MKKLTLLIIVFTIFINVNLKAQKTAADTFRLAASIYDKGEAAFKEKNYSVAFNFYGEAAKLNYGSAFSKLGVCNELAFGTKQDILKAVEWYKKGLQHNSAESGYRLGMLLTDGTWLKPQPNEGISAFKKAADLGNAESQFLLGNYYKRGEFNLVKNDTMAYTYYFSAAIVGGHLKALEKLGSCYISGEGVKADPLKGFELYKQAAEQGLVSSMMILGHYYNYGNPQVNVVANKAEAIKWYKKAADQGSEIGKKFYDRLNSQ